MQISEHIHLLRIDFKIPLKPDFSIERFVNVFLILCKDKIILVDSGVAGSTSIISDYLNKIGRRLEEIELLVLTHSHPDHVGDAINLQKAANCRIIANKNEQLWFENVDQQFKDRPVPGFYSLVAGSVKIDKFVDDGDVIQIDNESKLFVYSTPGHSSGSISLFYNTDKALICGDAVPIPDTQPIFEDYNDSICSIEKMKHIPDVNLLLSAWDDARKGHETVNAFNNAIDYLKKVSEAVNKHKHSYSQDRLMQWIELIVTELNLDKSAINPLVVKSFLACLK